MILRYYGHSLFTLTSDDGKVVLTDPYGDFYEYPKQNLYADVVTVSHQHHDHNSVDMVLGAPVIVEETGEQIARGISITGFKTYHDDVMGQKRGENTCYLIELDGLRFLHLGDLGHPLTNEQAQAFGEVDVLMLPIGGFYTIDPEQALGVMHMIGAKVTIPMHYRTEYSLNMPIAPIESFTALTEGAHEPVPVLRLQKEDISQRSPLIVMSIAQQA